MNRILFTCGSLILGVGLAVAAPALPIRETIPLRTKDFTIVFAVGSDGRLYQRPVGSVENGKTQRGDEAYPQAGDGYYWEPGLAATHADGNTSTKLIFQGVQKTHDDRSELVRFALKDPAYPFEATLCFRLHHKLDVIEQWAEIQHQEPAAVALERMASSALLLPGTNVSLTHFYGDWANEMNPVSELLTPGLKIIDSKIGTRAHRFASPSFMLSLDGPVRERTGRVLAGSLGWSGSFQCAFDSQGGRIRALCGVNPFASTYYLEPGKKFVTPVMIWAWSSHGAGEMSRKLHAWARDCGLRDGQSPRSVLLNNWEATKFDFDFNRIAGLFPRARNMGVELFLLDDGWFGNKYPRVNDKGGLGDWEPNRERFADGLAPLAQAAKTNGLEFGIWIEPEMVNVRSELFERHPDWVIRQPGREMELQRNQLVLDLTRPAVRDFEWSVIHDALAVPGISYSKWDCNRYWTQPGSPWLPKNRQSHLWIDYVNELYALMAHTAAEFPRTELMLCSGGGGRVDYGALQYFHEFWPSDNTDPVRRVTMQWNYSYFFPALSIASHVTHMGQRPMHFACAVAMSGRYGMDLDLARLSAEETAICASAIKDYKTIREVVHLGDLYRLESPHEGPRAALNYVRQDQSRAVLFVFQLLGSEPKPVRPEGLDPSRRYRVRELNPAPGSPPLEMEGKIFTGAELMRVGIKPSCSEAVTACVLVLEG